MKHKIDLIGIAIDPSAASGRDMLNGILEYVRCKAHWRVRLFLGPDGLSDSTLASLPQSGMTGFIDALPSHESLERRLATLPFRFAVVTPRAFGYHERTSGLTFISNDDLAVGCCAAQYLLHLGNFKSFGFVRMQAENPPWSQEREAGFRAELKKAGMKTNRYRSSATNSIAEHERLSKWLMDLPKPAALLASCDDCARHVLETCEQSELRVPEEISVVGVDNDELVCPFSVPPLTSIQLDHVKLGYTAAAELHRLLQSQKPKPIRVVRIGGVKLIERQSTCPPVYGRDLVERARSFIERNIHTALTPADVVENLGVSRRLADLRFHEHASETISEMILRLRLENVRCELTATTLKISQIARNNNFALPHLARLFKARYALTMSALRRNPPKTPFSTERPSHFLASGYGSPVKR